MQPTQALEILNKARLEYKGSYQEHCALDLAVKCLQGLIDSLPKKEEAPEKI